MVHIIRTTNYRDVFILLTFFRGGGSKKWKSEIFRNMNYRYVLILLDGFLRTNYSDVLILFDGFLRTNYSDVFIPYKKKPKISFNQLGQWGLYRHFKINFTCLIFLLS